MAARIMAARIMLVTNAPLPSSGGLNPSVLRCKILLLDAQTRFASM